MFSQAVPDLSLNSIDFNDANLQSPSPGLPAALHGKDSA